MTQASKYEEMLFKKLKGVFLKSAFVNFSAILNKRKICETSDKPMMIFALTVDRQAGHGIWVSQMFSMYVL